MLKRGFYDGKRSGEDRHGSPLRFQVELRLLLEYYSEKDVVVLVTKSVILVQFSLSADGKVTNESKLLLGSPRAPHRVPPTTHKRAGSLVEGVEVSCSVQFGPKASNLGRSFLSTSHAMLQRCQEPLLFIASDRSVRSSDARFLLRSSRCPGNSPVVQRLRSCRDVGLGPDCWRPGRPWPSVAGGVGTHPPDRVGRTRSLGQFEGLAVFVVVGLGCLDKCGFSQVGKEQVLNSTSMI